jgi:hypothetical protein
MTKLTRKEYDWIFSLQKSQKTMLKGKDEVLSELYNICDTEPQKLLVREMIVRFNCFEEEIYNLALGGMANYIASLGYPLAETAVVAFCHDSEADSSQGVLQDLKVPLSMACKQNIRTINRFDKIQRYYNKDNIRYFIAVDEFVGSGQTIINRNTEFQRLKLDGAFIDYCLMAGMEDALKLARNNGINIHIEYTMKKGISGYYANPILQENIKEMEQLESKLAKTIEKTQLNDHRFGYCRTEALYSRQYRNIPNNVFPLFWWKKNVYNNSRVTLFDRVQDGY